MHSIKISHKKTVSQSTSKVARRVLANKADKYLNYYKSRLCKKDWSARAWWYLSVPHVTGNLNCRHLATAL